MRQPANGAPRRGRRPVHPTRRVLQAWISCRTTLVTTEPSSTFATVTSSPLSKRRRTQTTGTPRSPVAICSMPSDGWSNCLTWCVPGVGGRVRRARPGRRPTLGIAASLKTKSLNLSA